jgi:hypothetical protein
MFVALAQLKNVKQTRGKVVDRRIITCYSARHVPC